MDIQLGYWRWKIYRWNEHPNPFRGRSDLALQWLRHFQKDRLAMSELRAQLTASGADAQRWADDNRVLQEVAARLSTGEFQVCAESSHPFNTAVATVSPSDPEADAAEALNAPPAPPPPPAPKPEAAPSPTLPENCDAAQVAEVLKQAAQNGAPFCEECEKAKESKVQATPATTPSARPAPSAQPAPATAPAAAPTAEPAAVAAVPVEATFPPSADLVAIAANLQTAAGSGKAFCAECERARLAQGVT